ncbi:class I SAM-dependent RNA methyltransferase [Sphingorhabdus sp. IMCC26285]|jgi:23S rRNA (uracil1939-C5)-methyltransferase|uniref:Class I SAM-dependent RNA methyltransferase n=1 Tax=Sphingorhabdus profundilacus TaxID=2509718 RepID=A0A6I4LVC1_9SPHN|nr:class I SAM-dependent RNA methyltransferase [Sphingorhabdus profundilacus]MVZ96981.1 class I SAM-dependent RNA methyltransferase [Sphingorhabdus profundilacus]
MTVSNEVIRVAARGDGVTADGRYVAHAAPGDLLDPLGGLIHGPHHATPPCRHFPLCGGCQLQHLDEDSLRTFIAGRVTHALATQQVDIGEVMPVHLSPPTSRRRVAVRSAWAGKQLHLGFSTEKSHRIIDLQQCDVMAPQLFALLNPLRALIAPRLNRARQVQIKLAVVDQGVDVLIENWIANDLDTHEALSEFAKTYHLARLSLDEGYGPVPFWEPEPVTISLGGVAVAYTPYGFLQATCDGEAALIAAVHEITSGKSLIADLFAGLGTFALSFGTGVKVYAGEADREAITGLKAAAGRAGRSIFAEHRDLFRRPLSAGELNKFQAVILDPPRAGAKEQVAQLAASDVGDVAYVSCNPASFARDAKTLVAAGYRLQRIWPIGQFRWSTHIELVGQFTR